MNRQEIVRIVAEKLQIDESIVDAVYMHQTQAVSESLKHPDRNNIFFPELGTLNFKVSKAADKLHTYLRKIDRYKAKIKEVDNPRTVASLKNRVNQMAELSTVLKWKVSLEVPKYNGIRMEPINKSLAYYSGGKFLPMVEELRKQRPNGFNTETLPEPEETMGEQTGDRQVLPEVPVLPKEGRQAVSETANRNMQKKFLRTVRS